MAKAVGPTPGRRLIQHCTIIIKLDDINVRARVRDDNLILDVPDGSLAELRRRVGNEVDGLIADLHRVQ